MAGRMAGRGVLARLLVVGLLLTAVLPASAPERHAASAQTLAEGLAAAGDFKGNGRTQIASLYDPNDDLGLRIVVLDRAGETDAFTHEQWLLWGTNSFDQRRAKVVATDVDFDGLDDLVVLYEDGPVSVRLLVFKSTGTNFIYFGAWWQSDGYAFGRTKGMLSGNFSAVGNNGLLLVYQYDDFEMRIHYLESDGTRFLYGGNDGVYDSGPGQYDTARARFAIGRFTRASGPDQIASIYQYPDARIRIHVFDPTPDGLVPVNGWDGVYDSGAGQFDLSRMRVTAADLDGDGFDDLASFYTYPDGSGRVHWFTGAQALALVGGTAGIAYLPPGSVSWAAAGVVAGDWDGDALGDLATLVPDDEGVTHAAMLRGTATAGEMPVLTYAPDAWTTPAEEVQPPQCVSCWPLSGMPLDGGPVQRRALSVRIDNSPAARPHFGISDADMVFELEVEAGITRLAAIFHSKDPAMIGSVRSARLSDRYLTPMVRGALVYSGATVEETAILRADAQAGAFIDLNATYGLGGYYRVPFRVTPYNMFASSAGLRNGVNLAGGGGPVDIPRWRFLRNLAHSDTAGGMASGVPAAYLSIPYQPSALVEYRYDPASRTYSRWQAGVREVDAAVGIAIAAKNVVIVHTDIWLTDIVQDIFGSLGVDMRLTGGGRATIFRNGLRVDGVWARESDYDAFNFYTTVGEKILLSPGQTWVHVIRTDWVVTSN
ncbi:MAG: DUF3048 domain-containing protein [Candidatus Limnocylindria bacterium]